MPNNSRIEAKSAYELEKNRLRFNGWEGQMQGAAHSFTKDFIIKADGAYPFPKHLEGNDGDDT